jgi:hexokinase
MSDESRNTSRAGTSLAVICAGAAVAIAAYAVYQRVYASKASSTAAYKLEEFRKAASTPLSKLRFISNALCTEMHAGLIKDGESRLKMLVSYVDELPNGHERGVFYALDLGGTNFRVLRVKLAGKAKRVEKSESIEVSIPQEAMTGTSEVLFDFIADEVAKFVKSEGPEYGTLQPGQKRELGFTFSFPCNQTAIDGGTLVRWTKGFKVSGTVGKDVVKLLSDALNRKGVDMRVAALVNDTVGTLAGGRYNNNDVMVGLILGTGSNACYVEDVHDIPKWTGGPVESGEMVINMEWGDFYSAHLPITDIDRELDEVSVNPGEQPFEKLISGMYLGEIVRRVLLRLAEEAGLFGSHVPAKLRERFALKTPDISQAHADQSTDLKVVGRMLKNKFGIEQSTQEERELVVDLIEIVVERGARLAGAGIVGVLKKIGRDGSSVRFGSQQKLNARLTAGAPTVVGVDGGLFEHYAFFRNTMQGTIGQLLGDNAKLVSLELTKDGSGIGAALLAATYSKYKQK